MECYRIYIYFFRILNFVYNFVYKLKLAMKDFAYKRSSIKAGIVHIGVGNFHRAHLQYLTNKLLNDSNQSNWGICGAMLLPSDQHLYNALKEQDNIYTLTVCDRKGGDSVYRIGSLVELIWSIDNPEEVINKIADADIKIITMTITEGGYNIDKKTGNFIFDNTDVKHDLMHWHNPITSFGFVAEGLRQRKASGNGPITILSCDNLQHNGDTARKAFTSFFLRQDKDLAAWVEQNVTFPNSMVDRITPATTEADVQRLNIENHTEDKAPVYCEDFIQWVVEDKFIAGRPSWEKVGVEFTDDVTAYENMKLSLLNASHTMLCYPAFLMGYRKVDEAMNDENVVKYLRAFMDKDITSYVPAPGDTDLSLYKQTLIERFSNRVVSDQLARICFDGISKYPVYIMPNLIKMIRDEADVSRVAFSVAAYRHYLKYKVDDKGNAYEIKEPWLTANDMQLVDSDNPTDFLALSAFTSTDLKQSHKFVEVYLQMVTDIKEKGTVSVLSTLG